MDIIGKEIKYQLAEFYKKFMGKMKKTDDLHEEMKQKCTDILLKLSKLDTGEISKYWKSRPNLLKS